VVTWPILSRVQREGAPPALTLVWTTGFLVCANSPNLCPTMSSTIFTGMNLRLSARKRWGAVGYDALSFDAADRSGGIIRATGGGGGGVTAHGGAGACVGAGARGGWPMGGARAEGTAAIRG